MKHPELMLSYTNLSSKIKSRNYDALEKLLPFEFTEQNSKARGASSVGTRLQRGEIQYSAKQNYSQQWQNKTSHTGL